MLEEAEFRTTFAHPMADVTADPGGAIDIWPYVNTIPAEDLEGHEVWERFVEQVHRGADGCYDHVLVMIWTRNVYLVVVVDRRNKTIHGHRLLDLHREYHLP